MTTETRYDVLEDGLLSIDGASVTLPGLLARLGAGVPTEMSALQSHQQHAWHAFLVQLAAIALHRAGDRRLDRGERDWRDALLALTDGAREPWCLVDRDLGGPALLQPPVPEGSIASWKTYACSDELDVLVTAKNHDVKAARVARPSPEHWLYALVSLQTTQGFSGRDNYGIARMNSGFGSRPCVAAGPDVSTAGRFRRDVSVWLEMRDQAVARFGYSPTGHALLWLVPWDGKSSLAITECDPFFVEVCRRVRLEERAGRLVARTAPSKAPRLEAKLLKGNTGDVWTPVAKDDGAALTISASGFHYARLADLLFGESFEPSAALALRAEDGNAPVAIARGIVRGQGKTEGLHERVVPIPRQTVPLFGTFEGRATLGKLAQERIRCARDLRLRVLKPALLALAQGGPDDLKLDDGRMDRFLDEADALVDARFFEALFDDVERPPEERDRRWERALFEIGKRVLERAIGATPMPAVRRYAAIASAERRFHGAARKHLPAAFDATTPTSEEKSA